MAYFREKMQIDFAEPLGIPTMLEKVSRTMKKSLQMDFIREGVSVTVEQYIVLDQIEELGASSATQIAHNTFKDAPSITRFMKSLIDMGLVNRKEDDKDRRKFSFTVTKKGKQLLEELRPLAKRNNAKWLDDIPKKDLEKLEAVLQTLMDKYYPSTAF